MHLERAPPGISTYTAHGILSSEIHLQAMYPVRPLQNSPWRDLHPA